MNLRARDVLRPVLSEYNIQLLQLSITQHTRIKKCGQPLFFTIIEYVTGSVNPIFSASLIEEILSTSQSQQGVMLFTVQWSIKA
ncbi:hypothetical protein D3C75_1274870 [compost metagenome]